MAVINMLPHGGAGIKGSKVFAWFEDGVIDTSEAFGGMVGNTETNGRNNLSTIADDGYLRIYYSQSAYGRSMISTENTVPLDAWDYVLIHFISLRNADNGSNYFTSGMKTNKGTGAVSGNTLVALTAALSDTWFALPLAIYNSYTSVAYYMAFGGTVDARIDKIYFVKIKS